MTHPAEDSYPNLANLALSVPSPTQREAQLVLGEINKWRARDEADEKAWRDVVPDD